MAYWLLTTHGVALFPIGYFMDLEKTKDAAAIFMCIKFLYCVTFHYYITHIIV